MKPFRDQHLTGLKPQPLPVPFGADGQQFLDGEIARLRYHHVDGLPAVHAVSFQSEQLFEFQLLIEHKIHVPAVSDNLSHVRLGPLSLGVS